MSDKKTQGKPASWSGPVEEYVVNEGDVGRKKIAFIGASYKFVHKVLRDMLLVGGFNEVELCVHDIIEKPMNIVADLLERIARQTGSSVKVSRTLSLGEALKGADAAVLSITTGGRETDQRTAEACARHGIPVAIGDTMGPAALARNLREIPHVVHIVREMERICPDAVMLNFTNPLSAITCAMARYSSIPAYGLCHSADELYRFFSEAFECKKSDIHLDVGGVNHQCFVTKLTIAGKDRTSEILDAVERSGAKFQDSLLSVHTEEVAIQRVLFQNLGAWPSTGHTHAAEFYPFFFTERRMDELGVRSDTRKIVPGRAPFSNETPVPDIIREWAYGPDPVGDLHLLTSEHAHELLWAHFTGEPFTRILNVLNTDELLVGIPRDACVEVQVTISGRKITGKPLQLPTAIDSLVRRWTSIHDLSIRAAMECDRDLARQALLLDPHVRDIFDIPLLLEDMLIALKEWLPGKWFA